MLFKFSLNILSNITPEIPPESIDSPKTVPALSELLQ